LNTGKRQSKVIISATCFADADAAIVMAISLAQKVKGDLFGLLVEDESILRYADLPFAKVVAFQSGTPQQVTPEAMASAFRSDARTFKAILAKSAMDASINWSFESKRGQMMSLLHSMASKGDLILLGHQQSPMLSGEIIYLDYSDANDSNFRKLANQIADEMNVPFQVISSGNTQASAGEYITTHHSEDQVLELLHNKSLNAVFIAASEKEDPDIYKILEAARCPIIYLVKG
jgi:hypothetical protein